MISVILSVIWVIIMFTLASIIGWRGYLYTSAFLSVICISFTLLLFGKWLYGFMGLFISSILFYSVYSLEPNGLNMIRNLDYLIK